MLLVEFAILGTLLVDCVLGLIVYFTNTKRVVNQHYLSFATCVALWQLSGWYILQATTPEGATLAIRWASVFAALIPTSCHLLRLTIKCPEHSFWATIYTGRYYLFTYLFVVFFCFTDFFLQTTILPENPNSKILAEPQYGHGLPIYALYFFAMGLSLIISFRRDMKSLIGVQRSELSFVVLGATVALFIGSLLSLSIPLIIRTSRYVPFTNSLSILALVATIGYGIATHKILGILTIIRKTFAYILLTLYLILIYLCAWSLSAHLLNQYLPHSDFLSHIIATLAVAFSMTPAHGRVQKVAEKLIVSRSMDVAATLKTAGEIFRSVTTSDAILDHFSKLLMDALSTDRISILSLANNRFKMKYCSERYNMGLELPLNNPVLQIIEGTKESVSRDSLLRTRTTVTTQGAIETLINHDIHIAVGVFLKKGLSGIVLLGAKLDGRIYDRTEQDALQILCNQFAVALENAQMYTEMQDSKIRNEIMLDQLLSGVIFADIERKITLFNHEAQRITGIREEDAMGMFIDLLPRSICRALDHALQLEHGQRSLDARLFEQDETKKSLNIRMGTTFLVGHDQKPMGALLVFTDITELRNLEEQVRRSDQLSSVGTLAAGMAHEIKNPLVTIKTFTQLLPQRYDDEDFRKGFSELVAQEVSRIDEIVNELLSFSKPTKPHLIPMDLHETIDQILKLTHEQMAQKNISLNHNTRAKSSQILGDAKLLSQALINLSLNAIEAIGNGGTITVGTTNCQHRFANGSGPDQAVTKQCIRIQISDTGEGIPAENIEQIFDPFFTSKSAGTGMGLSVAHGIIREHHGVIDVESELGIGTSFYIYLPSMNEEVL
jgi:two-component system nitrogen regulation sensor histidine kinase GlnL